MIIQLTIDRLKTKYSSQLNENDNENFKENLIINERHEAWGNLARKMAHEIKNPLTPIQLTIDRLKNKYSNQLNETDKENFRDNLKIINNQIKQIEKLVNEFSDFARMPKPIFKKNDILILMRETINLLSELDKSININLISETEMIIFNCDREQLGRVFLNLIKNSIESIQEKSKKMSNFSKNIAIELKENDSHINLTINDTGIGFKNISPNIKDIMNPYFTTKQKGTGLGLSIVNKIINDHSGNIEFISKDKGAEVKILFRK